MIEAKFILYLCLSLLLIGFVLSVLYSFTDKNSNSAQKRIEKLLPGINCGQCGYPGCQAYASALANHEAQANLCKPAGADVAKQVSELTGSSLESGQDYEEQLFTPRTVAYIHDEKCTGCGKCKRKCPVDAISGVLKQAHVVDPKECIGCDECVATCPEKCIEMIRQDHTLEHFNWNIHSVQIKSGN